MELLFELIFSAFFEIVFAAFAAGAEYAFYKTQKRGLDVDLRRRCDRRDDLVARCGTVDDLGARRRLGGRAPLFRLAFAASGAFDPGPR